VCFLHRCFGDGFRLNITSSLRHFHGKALLGETCMVRNNYKSFFHSTLHVAIGFLWKHECKVTFQEESSFFSLGELRSFKQDLALLARAKLNIIQRDVQPLSLGAQAHIITFLSFLGWNFLGPPCDVIFFLMHLFDLCYSYDEKYFSILGPTNQPCNMYIVTLIKDLLGYEDMMSSHT